MKRFLLLAALFAVLPLSAQNLVGTVRCDGKPVPGVCVSDGISIVRTDAEGRYALKSDKRQGFVFISSPSGYTVPLKDGLQPDFYRPLTQPAGVTETNDFELVPQKQDAYTVVFATDIHIKNDPALGERRLFETHVLPHVKELYAKHIQEGPVVLFNLGDFAHDKLWYRFDWNIGKSYEYFRSLGYPGPFYSVMGNHDNDGAAVATPYAPNVDFNAEQPYRRVLGPTYYSMDIGKDHWIMLDNIIYLNDPTEQPTDPGLAGKRNYRIGFTEDEWTWLEKDIALVPADRTVRIAAHASFLFEFPAGKGTQMSSTAEMDRLYALVTARQPLMYAYTGHTHRFQYGENPRYPKVRDLMIPAISGNVWNTGENQMIGIDACDAGILVGHFRGGETSYDYITHLYGEKWMRLYDMNTTVPFLKGDARSLKRIEKSDYVTDYTAYTGKNEIYANIWMWRPEWTVEMLEGRRKLKVERIDATDPLLLASPNSESFYRKEAYVVNKHLFRAQARSARSTITVRILDENGKVLHSEKMIRPKAFSLDME